jgi:hypothetical protein
MLISSLMHSDSSLVHAGAKEEFTVHVCVITAVTLARGYVSAEREPSFIGTEFHFSKRGNLIYLKRFSSDSRRIVAPLVGDIRQ